MDPLRHVIERHYEEYGRHFCTRLDYEALDPQDASDIFEALRIKIRTPIVFVHAWFHYGTHSYQVS